jgi:hypothetical protein
MMSQEVRGSDLLAKKHVSPTRGQGIIVGESDAKQKVEIYHDRSDSKSKNGMQFIVVPWELSYYTV